MDPSLPQPLPRLPSAGEIVPTIQRHVEETRKLINDIKDTVTSATASFDNVIRPLAELENSQAGEQAVIDALKYCSPDAECRNSSEQAKQIWTEYKSHKDRGLYVLVKAVKNRSETLDEESQKLVDVMLSDFVQNGMELIEEESIGKWRRNQAKIQELSVEFHRNLRESETGEWFTPDELDGVPEQDRATYSVNDQDGKVFVSHSGRTFAIMQFAKNPETRKRMYLSNCQRFSENVGIFREVLLLRDENARELGYQNHAASRIPSRIAESTEWIDSLLDGLSETLLPYAKADEETDRKRMEDCARDNGNNSPLMEWDKPYYRNLSPHPDRVDHRAFAEYFPLRHTVGAMMEVFAGFLQLRFKPVSGNNLTDALWHPDVELWSVWDERSESRGSFIGYLYADLLNRPDKYKGNQSVNLQRGYLKPDGTRVFPANIIMCNFQGARPRKGCVLSHFDLVTLFHEFGHTLHDLLARTKYSRFHGYEAMREFVEGIGMTLENWCWLKDEVKAMSCHYTRVDPAYESAWLEDNPGRDLPPEKIPDDLLEKRFKTRARDKLLHLLGDLVLSLFDMAVHSPPTRDALLQMDEAVVYGDIYEKLRFNRLPSNNIWARHGHLLSGFDAGYYAYICAQVFAADIFQTTFAQNPRSQEAWEKFRREVLEYGGSRNELEILRAHLGGREPSLIPLLNIVKPVERENP